MSSGASSRPAGRPSTIPVRPGPCDSPAVVKRSAISREEPYFAGALLRVLRSDAGEVQQAREHCGVGFADGLAAEVLAERRSLARRVRRVTLSLVVRDELAVQLEQLELVDRGAVERGERLLVLLRVERELDEAAVLLVVALPLAGGREGRIGDEEERALGIAGHAHEDDRRGLLVGQHREVGDALHRLLRVRRPEADVRGVAEPLERLGRALAARGAGTRERR